MAERIFLVRHGDYNIRTGSLTGQGREVHAPQARQRLLVRGVGEGALILSSSAPRAFETAQIIAEGLPSSTLAKSELINAGGNRVGRVGNLDDLLTRAALEAQVEIPTEGDLVVVTHAPMVAVAIGEYGYDATNKIRYGQVVQYEPNTWRNPDFWQGDAL